MGKDFQKVIHRDFPGGPQQLLDYTLPTQELRCDPWSGNGIPHATIKTLKPRLKILHATMKMEDLKGQNWLGEVK